MTDKDKLIAVRAKIERLKGNLLRGTCSSQIAMETRCKEEAYNEVLAILDTMQEDPTIGGINNALIQDCLAMKSSAESLGISPEEHDKIVDKYLYGKEPELVDADDLPKEEPTITDIVDKHYWEMLGEEPVSNIEAYQNRWGKSNGYRKPVSEELEEASLEYWKQQLDSGEDTLKDAFKNGAKWQKEQMMKDAVDGIVYAKTNGDIAVRSNYYKSETLNYLDYVKLIIIKED